MANVEFKPKGLCGAKLGSVLYTTLPQENIMIRMCQNLKEGLEQPNEIQSNGNN